MSKIPRVEKAKNTYLTSKGLSDARVELDYLKKTKRVQIAERIHQAREYGDITENSEYDAAVEEQSLMENRISELEEVLKNARVISEKQTTDFVVIGSTVKIEMDDGIDEFKIVGRVEADPSKKRISNESPLGMALLGAKKGEEVDVATPIVRYKCKVLEIK
ncbi:transcription elongation factor GreA [Candidatus Daviesbacteria bacterium]|nr:transcription elongation factor GreA [Candidatus Daviesbacteria bacterium]